MAKDDRAKGLEAKKTGDGKKSPRTSVPGKQAKDEGRKGKIFLLRDES